MQRWRWTITTPKKSNSTLIFSENTACLSKRELGALKTQQNHDMKKLLAEVEELKEKIYIFQRTTDAIQTRSEPVGGGHYKIRIYGTIGKRVYTGSDVKGQYGEQLKVVICYDDKRVTWEPFASAEFEILVVQGDFCVNDQESWSADKFEGSLVKARKEVRVILASGYTSKFSNGEAVLHGLKFKDNSSWTEGRKWRLGIRVLGNYNVRVLEAVSEPFRVYDRHGKDGVDCLERIGHKRASTLRTNGIHTVGHFLQLYHQDQTRLREMLGINSELDESWKAMISHAKECNAGLDLHNFAEISNDVGTPQCDEADVKDIYRSSSNSYDQMSVIGTDADQNARPDRSTVQRYNLIQDQATGAQDRQQVTIGTISFNFDDQMLDAEIDADQIATLGNNTLQHYNSIQDHAAGVQDKQQVSVDMIFSDFDLPITETDADQNARPDHDSVQHCNTIEGETSIQEVEQKGSFAPISTAQLAQYENLLGLPKLDSQNDLWNTSINYPDSPAGSELEIETWLNTLKGHYTCISYPNKKSTQVL